MNLVIDYLPTVLDDKVYELCKRQDKLVVPLTFIMFPFIAGRGNWSAEGCAARNVNNRTGVITCDCNHLTNFAILVVS